VSFEPEALLGQEDGAAFRRFVEWSVGSGFDMAVVEIATPWKRDALMAWTQEKIPGAKLIPLHEVGPGKQMLWDLLREACAPGSEATALILHHLEEAEDKRRIIAQLNVERDELVKAFALPWILLVHPVAGRELQHNAPDFSDFVGLWLWEEAPEGFEALRAGIDAPSVVVAPTPVGTMGPGKELLVRAANATHLGYLDEAADLVAQFDLRNPAARGADPDRMLVEARMLAATGRFVEARAVYEAAQNGYLAQGNRAGLALSLHLLAIVAEGQGRYEEARALLRGSMAVKEEVGDRAGLAASLHQLASVEWRRGRYEEARTLLQEAITIFEEIGDRVARATSLHQLATVEEWEGRYEEARALLRASIAVKEEVGDRAGLAASLHQLASVDWRQGQYEEAGALVRESMAINEESGNRAGRAASLHLLALIQAKQGQRDEARALLRESIAIKQEIGDTPGLAASLIMLGQLELMDGRVSEGRGLVQQGVDILAEIGSGDLDAARTILQDIDSLSTPPAATST